MSPDPISLSMDDRRLLACWAADCAERALSLFEATSASDSRARDAIEGARLFGQGGRRTVQLRSQALAALAAAREADEASAAAAARSAGFAAATAYTKALANPHHANHALGPAVYAALARELAADNDARAGDEEIRRAIDQASPTVREIVSRWPARMPGRTRLSALYYQLDSGLRQ